MALVPAKIAGVAFPTAASSIQASGTADETTFLRGDGTWAEIPAGSGNVNSVNGKIGDVILTAEDVGALSNDYVAPVSSVNGQTGSVTVDGSTFDIMVLSEISE